MIDKSLPYIPIVLTKTDTRNYPRHDLPEGYSFAFYQKGDERAWAELEYSLGQFESVEDGIECFYDEFLNDQVCNPEERMFFVKDEKGKCVATLSLWDGIHLGKKCQRAHWLAVSDECAGKGIAKALFTRLLDLYNELGYEGFIYLLTATWYYPAIGIYRKFGFSEYRGEKSLEPNMSDSEFKIRNEKAIALVDEKLSRK